MQAPKKITQDKTTRHGGRPSREEAGLIEGRILDIAHDLFFAQGYGATSIEMVAKQAGISKRTFYQRFQNKSELFHAVVHRLIARLRPANTEHLFEGKTLEKILEQLAHIILAATLSPQALALHRLILAEAARFPELALAVNQQGTRQEAIDRIAELLRRMSPGKNRGKASFAAGQFLHMVTAEPQRRALGLGKPMNADELAAWAHDTVQLFLQGCGGVEKPVT